MHSKTKELPFDMKDGCRCIEEKLPACCNVVGICSNKNFMIRYYLPKRNYALLEKTLLFFFIRNSVEESFIIRAGINGFWHHLLLDSNTTRHLKSQKLVGFFFFSVLVVLRIELRVLYRLSKCCTSLLWLFNIANNMVPILSLAHQIRLRHNTNIYQYINFLK